MKGVLKKYLTAITAVVLTVSVISGCSDGSKNPDPEGTVPPRTEFTNAPKAAQMVDTGEWQQRWLSIPESRIVINPYNFPGWDPKKPQSAFTDSGKLPLNIGYLDPYYHDGDGGNRLYDTLMILDTAGATKEAREAKEYNTSWAPHMLGFEGTYNSGMKVSGKDYFYDTNTVIREVTFEGENAPIFGGIYYNASSTEEKKDIKSECTIDGNTVVINNKNYTIAISFSTDMEFTFYKDYGSFLANMNYLDVAVKDGNMWSAKVKDTTNKSVNIAVTVLSNLTSKEDTAAASRNALNDENLKNKLGEQEKFWDDYLQKVPVPGTFEIETIDSLGVTSKSIDQMYYEAWILLAADVLPPNPETGFKYKQMACGKPSMWAWGHPTAAFTAAWDSIYAYHMYAFVDPDTAWDCYMGLMSLVEHSDDPNRHGMLAGESLPVNRARTAWLLYEMKPDKEKLEEVFENLDINLDWAMNHTYWIYRGNAGLNEKTRDPDFTAAAYVDMPYMIRICNELGKADKAKEWEEKMNEFGKSFPKWHIMTAKIDGERVKIAKTGNTLWTCKSLYIPQLTEEEDWAFYRRLKTEYNTNTNFMGFRGVKVEEIMYCIYGLYDNADRGQEFIDMAKTLNESSIREVVRARIFSENYEYEKGTSQCYGTGVRSNMFGVVQLIDSIWIRNGFRYDTCQPTVQNFFGKGSMENVRYGDKVLNFKLENDKATFTGSYVGEEKVIDLPMNSQAKPFAK